LKKSLIFAALVSVVLFSNCKKKEEVVPTEQMETVIDSTAIDSTAIDSVKADEVTPTVEKKDTLTAPKAK
jgi:hypothetical protein